MKVHERLLERMRRTRTGWKPKDFRVLYTGFGFEEIDASKHTKYRHPRYPHLWTMVKRADPLSRAYADDALELIDELLRLEENG